MSSNVPERVQGVVSISAARTANIYSLPLLQVARIKTKSRNQNFELDQNQESYSPLNNILTGYHLSDHIHLRFSFSGHVIKVSLGRPKTCFFTVLGSF